MLVWPLCGPISGLSLFFQQSGRFILLQIALFSVANNTTRARFAHFDCFTFGWRPCSRNLWLLNTGEGVSSITYLHPLTYSPPPPLPSPLNLPYSLEYYTVHRRSRYIVQPARLGYRGFLPASYGSVSSYKGNISISIWPYKMKFLIVLIIFS